MSFKKVFILSNEKPSFPLIFVNTLHFTETHRKTSNFDMCLLNFISTCLCFIQKLIYHLKRNWPRFSLPKICRSSIYVIAIVKFSNRPIQIYSIFLSELLWISVKCLVTISCLFVLLVTFIRAMTLC